jgi:hypothetical protein
MTKEFIEKIQQAQVEAIKKGIKANTVLINDKIGYVKPFLLGRNSIFPPMICGLEVQITDELPECYDFLICENPVTERERLISDACKETARECLKILHSIGGCGATEDYSRGWDNAINEAYKEISDKYGVTAFEEEDENENV